jgi:hypothetical protein
LSARHEKLTLRYYAASYVGENASGSNGRVSPERITSP